MLPGHSVSIFCLRVGETHIVSLKEFVGDLAWADIEFFTWRGKKFRMCIKYQEIDPVLEIGRVE